MALNDNQLALIKLYMAAFNRAPEKGGFDYWSNQLASGKTFAQVVDTVFSLDIVKAIYPDAMPNDAFLTLIYINIFNKLPDDEGLAFWMSQLGTGRARGSLVLDMINAGLGTPDGTPGKAYIANRYSVSQYAVDVQLQLNKEISIDNLKVILGGVSDTTASLTSAKDAIDNDNSGGLRAPTNALTSVAAVNGINPAEKTAGVAVVANLTGTSAVAGNIVELLLNGAPFATPITRALTAADITAATVSLTIPGTTNWGGDGTKVLTIRLKDTAGHVGPAGGALTVTLDTTVPGAPTAAITVAAAANSINATEKAAGFEAVVSLAGTNAVAGDTVELLIGGVAFSTPVTGVLTSADITAGKATVNIPGTANWGADGTKTLTARVKDVAGNTGAAGGSMTLVIDVTGPSGPAITIAAATNGISSAEETAGVAVVVNLTSTGAAAGDTVELLLGGVSFSTPVTYVLTAADITAKSATVTITNSAGWGADGTKVLTARITDTIGNLGAIGKSTSVVLDTVTPGALTGGITAAAATDGINTAEKTAGVAVTVDLTGSSAVAGDIVELLIDGVAFTTPVTRVLTSGDIAVLTASLTIASASGWGADGTKSLTARVKDTSGNASAAGGSLSVTLDTTAPAAPTVAVGVAAASNGLSNAEKNVGVVVTVDLAGTNAAAGDTVAILLGGAAFSTPATYVLTGADITAGTASVTIPGTATWGANGSKALTARVTDVAGNVGAAGGSFTLTLDATAPSAPSGAVAVAASTNGISAAEKAAGVAVVVSLAGTSAVAGDTVEVLIGGSSFSTPVTGVLTSGNITAGNVTLTINTGDGWGADGSKVLTARVTDIAGNIGTAGGSLPVTLDTIAPTVPTIAVVVAADAGGGINATEKTAGVSVIVDLTGTGAVANDIVELLIGGVAFGTPVTRTLSAADITANATIMTVATGSGWGIDGSKTLTARVTDVAGNVGTAGGSLSVTLDTTLPAAASSSPITYADVTLNGIDAGDTFVLAFSEATSKVIDITGLTLNNSHAFGTGATAVWDVPGMALTVTLGTGTNAASGDTIGLVGVADLAGNTATINFIVP